MFTALPAIAVLAALGTLLALAHHESVVRDRHMETQALAAAAATNARRFIDDQFATLSAVAASPAARGQRTRLLRPYLETVAGTARYTAGMGLIGFDGRLIASSNGLGSRVINLADRPYVRTVLDEGRPAVSDAMIGRRNGLPVLTFGFPVSSLAGPRNGVVYGSVRLDQIGPGLRRLLYAPGAGETIIDGAGHVIVSSTPVRALEDAPAAFDVARMRRVKRSGVVPSVQTSQGKRLLGFSKVLGTSWLVVVDEDHGEVIGPLDRALWAEIAALVLLALFGVLATMAGARRMDRLDAERETALAEQQAIALRLQRSLLPDVPTPASLQVHASYAPAQGSMAVGGDWYDVVELGDGRVALSVGDVAGHGLTAAAVMGQLRSAVRTLALGRTEPADALQQLDRFAGRLDGRPLATVVFAILDPATGLLRYAVAGHPPPLVLRAGGRTELLHEGRSPLLGVDPLEPRPEGETQLEAGDTLIFYTDGLVEQPDSSIDAGIEALTRRAATAAAQDPETLAAVLIEGVPEPRRDDTAVLCVRLAEAPDRASPGPGAGPQPSSVPS
jgi:serine phosphatase RsbU (regulator of sigma subunit)